jgi:hypothetical protein
VKSILVAAALALVVAGCGAGGQEKLPTDANKVILRLVEMQGLAKPGEPAAIVPTFSLYGDGRAIVQAPGSYSGALPNVRQLRLPRERVMQLVRKASDAGALDNRNPDGDLGPDAPIYLLFLDTGSDRGTSRYGPDDERDFEELQSALRAYATNKSATPYVPSKLAVLAAPDEAPSPGRVWTFGSLRGEARGSAFCTVYAAPTLANVEQAARAAKPGQVWLDANVPYGVAFRPLLPDEADCKALPER